MHTGVIRSVEVMLNGSLRRLDYLHGMNREALYDEYKEWINLKDNFLTTDCVLYCNYLG